MVRFDKGTRGEARRRLTRQFRVDATPAEECLWRLLRDRRLSGFKFRRQHPIGSFIADFYCPKAKLAIDLDGSVHDPSEQRDHDRQRDVALAEHGIRVLRISNGELDASADLVLARILDALSPPLHLRTNGEGGWGVRPLPSPLGTLNKEQPA